MSAANTATLYPPERLAAVQRAVRAAGITRQVSRSSCLAS